MTKPLLIAGLVLILGIANWAILGRERLKASGTLVYLELAPVDPRSLMQGDYMALRYAIDRTTPEAVHDGYLVIRLDQRRVAKAVGWNAEPGPGELRLRYRVRNGRTNIGTDAFFFEEGSGSLYQSARYGEFRVAQNGDALLTNLRDANLVRVGHPNEP
jgi:uncharacterized membrane-anchored protein